MSFGTMPQARPPWEPRCLSTATGCFSRVGCWALSRACYPCRNLHNLSMKMPTDCFYHVPSIKKWYIHMIIMNIWSTQISTHQWWRYRTAPMMCNWTAGDWSDFPVRSWLIQYWSMGETGPMCRPNQIGCDFFVEVNAINLFDWKSHEQTCANYNEREGKTSSWIKYIFSYNGIMPIRFHEGALSLQWSRVLASACSGGMDKATWGAAW